MLLPFETTAPKDRQISHFSTPSVQLEQEWAKCQGNHRRWWCVLNCFTSKPERIKSDLGWKLRPTFTLSLAAVFTNTTVSDYL